MIAEYNTTTEGAATLQSGVLALVRRETEEDGTVKEGSFDKLKLKPEYFAPYGDFTYIVIKATDSADKVAYQRIKIKLTSQLFDLTWNSVTEEEANKSIDISERRYTI